MHIAIEIMSAKLLDPIRSLVIQQWLQGRPRNDIASENGISSGAVTNIVNEWRHNLGFALADELRQLAIAFRKGWYYCLPMRSWIQNRDSYA